MIKYLRWAAVAFLVFYLFTQPEDAAHQASRLASGLAAVGGSLATFVTSLD